MVFLSVGMIVKNEEKCLARSLDSVRHLLKELEKAGSGGELVIVDTGSTDLTVEICKKYTEKVYSYEWKDDFADARNYGISHCEGKWFMYLDADEVLDEDVKPLLKFLTSKSNDAMTARLQLLNYADESAQIYTESHNLRLISMETCGSKARFSGEVHEGLPQIEPCVQISQIVHHYGYVVKDGENAEESLREKHRRNMPALLKAYKRNNKDPRTLAHLFYSCELKDKEQYLNEWYALLQDDGGGLSKDGNNKGKSSVYSLPVYVAILQMLVDGKCYQDALYYAEEYLNAYEDDNVTTMSVLALTVCALSSSGQPELAADFFENYEELYKKFREGKIGTAELETCVVFFGTSEADYYGLLLLCISDLIKSGNKNKARIKLIALDRKKMPKIFEQSVEEIEKSLKA